MQICISLDEIKDYIPCLNQVRTHLKNSPKKANAQSALYTQYNYFITFTSEKKPTLICISPCPTLEVKINYRNARGKTSCI